ncbi:prephenate dehydratase [Motilibacter rhizosphaerae]|uniref:Prephenate dehydratase n=1 Tax=Motilibacter rhizosphaerae TaxID=598652 RepID=A0A4Q7NVL5_9ACTN|nr:prephenate dehydratase [Motilibacter rhizosphaerae]RZS91303.1 prephenate dehydratase [Motilibacter rhizosphaerae]
MTTYAYFGPAGTFTEAATRSLPLGADDELVPLATVPHALAAVREGRADRAVVPIENSVEGGVPATLDDLASGTPLVILREVLVNVRFALLVRPGTTLADVRRIGTHPHGEAQCRRWLAEHVPQAAYVATSSTAAAAAALAAGTATYDAAISAPIAAQTYGLETLAEGVGDNPDGVTRFVLVSRPVPPPLPTGADRTTLVLSMRHDHPGALLQILDELAVRGVNLSRIESRPTGERLGDYLFSVDCDGHVDDANVGEALMGLRRVCADVRYLGSYPKAGQVPADRERAVADARFRDSAAWLARIRESGTA